MQRTKAPTAPTSPKKRKLDELTEAEKQGASKKAHIIRIDSDEKDKEKEKETMKTKEKEKEKESSKVASPSKKGLPLARLYSYLNFFLIQL